MLYRTSYQPCFFQFSSLTTPPIYFSLQEMERAEGALKSSRRKELSSQVVVVDELWSFNMQNAASCDDLFVEELLDFSNNDDFLENTEELVQSEIDEEEITQLKQETPVEDIKQDIDFLDSLPSSDLSLPIEELENLEWLSHFVEGSNSEYSASFLAGVLKEKPKVEENATEEASLFKTPVPGKARSKRTRTGVRVWPLGSPESSSNSSSSSSSTTTTTTASSSPWLICTSRVFDSAEPGGFEKPQIKKQKKKHAFGLSDTPCHGTGNGQPPRRCSHCGVQKTPQWRAGPLGAKTLCNACGVRFKSGRLLPEYRPACSPTFSSELHSNHHRRVLEMRKKKEITGQVQHGLVQSQVTGQVQRDLVQLVVSSF